MNNIALAETNRIFDVEAARQHFPILTRMIHGKPLAYLDNGASAQRAQSVIDAVDDYERHHHANIHRGVHTLSQEATAMYEGARDRLQRFINARSRNEIIFVRGTTEAINLVAQSYARPSLRAGDEVLITHLEHHANIVPWQMVCEQTGAKLVVAPMDVHGEVHLEAVVSLMNARTKILACAHVSNALGTILPVRRIVAAAKARGIITLLDGAQAISHMAVDVQELGCDFYAFSGHKMYGKGIEIAAQFLHVYRHMRNGLGAVEQGDDAAGLGGRDDAAHRQNSAQGIRYMRAGQYLGAGRHQRNDRLQMDFALSVHRRNHEFRAGLLAHHLPGHNVCVVLQMRDQDLVAGAQGRSCIALRHQVDRLGGAAYENDLATRARV